VFKLTFKLECSGPCDCKTDFVYGCSCGSICWHCEKGDNSDAPCPSSAGREEVEAYWALKNKG